MRHLSTWAVLTALLALFLAPATAEDRTKDAVSDEQFVQKASAAGLAEVNLGTLASQRGASADVKKFGQHMVNDHTKANKELATLADKKRFKVAERMDQAHQEAADKLAKLEGAEFDRQFAHWMVKDHEEAVNLFSAEAKDGKDEDLKAFATKTLPTLKEHLKMAQELEKTVKDKGR